MARRRHYPVFVLVSLTASLSLVAKCSELNQVYVLPPASILSDQENASATTIQDVHIVKPPEILLRNNFLKTTNASHSLQQQDFQAAGTNSPTPMSKYNSPHLASPLNPSSYHDSMAHRSPPSLLPPTNKNNVAQSSHLQQGSQFNTSIVSANPPVADFSVLHAPTMNETLPSINQNPFNSFNEVEQFLNFVPMDYENGQMPGFMPPHQKRDTRRRLRPANRRAGRVPPPRRNSTSAIKNIISSFHEKVSRIFLGPRRRVSRPMRQKLPQGKPQQNKQTSNDLHFDPTITKESTAGRSQKDLQQAPASGDNSFTAALNTVAQILKETQYIPMLGKRERIRTLSQEESQHLNSLRRRDRKPNRRRYPRRRYPRRRRPHYRDRPSYHDDSPPRYRHEPHYQEEENYHGKPKYHHFPKYHNDDIPPHKDHGPPYKGFRLYKSFKPWKQNFESYEDHEEYYRTGGNKGSSVRKPSWYSVDSYEKGSIGYPIHYQHSKYYSRPHHHEKYKEYSPEPYYDVVADTEGFKPINPFYGKMKIWDENKIKFHKVVDYDHGVLDAEAYGSKIKPGTSIPPAAKDVEAKIPKIIINHHHNLPPPSTGANIVTGTYPGNAVLSYTPQIHYSNEFYHGSRGGRRGRGRTEYFKTNDFADSFVVNDYGKPPIPTFGMPPASFGVSPHMPHPPQSGPAASPSGHMVFNHFAENMPPHFMHGKLPPPPPHINHVPYMSHIPGSHPISYSSSHFPPKPMHGPGPESHFPPPHSVGFPSFQPHPDSMEPFGKPFATQMESYNEMNENFPQTTPQGFVQNGGSVPSRDESPQTPPPDSSPFPSTNEDQEESSGFIPPFTPVPTREEATSPTQGPMSPASREVFFKVNHKRKKVPAKFEFKIIKTLSSGFEIPEKLLNHPLADQKPTPMVNYFDLGVPDREHYKKKKQRKNQNRDNNNTNDRNNDNRSNHNENNNSNNNKNNPDSREAYSEKHYYPPSYNRHTFETNEFNYSTLPDNWRNFRPDPSHNKLPKLTHDTAEGGSRMYKIRSALHPKSLMKAIINRFPRGRVIDRSSGRAHSKFTPFDAVSKSREDFSSANRKRRKSTKTPASIQDIINSDSSNHNKEVVVALSDDVFNNSNIQNLHEGEASASNPVIVMGKGRAAKPKIRRVKQRNKILQKEMPSKTNDIVALNSDTHSIDIPVGAEIRMGEASDKKKK